MSDRQRRRAPPMRAGVSLVVLALFGSAVPAHGQDPPQQPPAASPAPPQQPLVPVPPPDDARFRSYDYLQTTTGTVLWGRLESAEQGTVLFDILSLDEMTVKMKNIAVLIAHSTNFQVDIKGHERITGQIGAGDRLRVVTVSNGVEHIDTSLDEIIWVKRVEQSFFKRMDGAVSLGYSYTSASHIGRFNFAENALHSTEHTDLLEYYSVAATLGDATPGVDRIDGGVGGMLYIHARYVVAQYLLYQKIVSTGLDSRWTSITGGGVRFVHSRYMDMSVLSGVTFAKEKPIDGPTKGTETEIPLMVAYKLGGPDPKFLIAGSATAYASLSVSNRYRGDVRFNATYELMNHRTYGTVTLGSEILYSTDTKPPGGGTKTKDFNVSFNIGYSF